MVPNPPEGAKLGAEVVLVAADETLVDELLDEVPVDEVLVDEVLVDCARVACTPHANISKSALYIELSNILW